MQVEKVIKSDFGKEHTYMLTRHGFMEGKDIARSIAGIVKGAIDIRVESKDVDVDVGALIEAVASSLDDAMIVSLFKHTSRDGRILNRSTVNEVYQGNYGEFVAAVAFILNANFGPAIERVTGGKLSLLSGL